MTEEDSTCVHSVMAYHDTDDGYQIWVNDGYNVDKVSGGHWSMVARLGVARVAAISNQSTERASDSSGDWQYCVLASG